MHMEPEARVYNACIWVFREDIDSSIEQQQCTGSLAWRLLGNAATLCKFVYSFKRLECLMCECMSVSSI